MKLKVILVLPVLVWGCLKESTAQTNDSKASQSSGTARPGSSAPIALPFQLILVENEEAKDQAKIKTQVTGLLAAKDYNALDQMAHKFRESKACYPNGIWKLHAFYRGLELDDTEPEALWQDRGAALSAWIAAKPKSLTARVADANFLTAYAWKARGSDVASTVTEAGWKLFAERLNQAANVLTNVGQFEEQCPYRWMVLLRVALGLNVEKPAFGQLLGKALRTEPGYTGYYYRQAIYLLPRWFGDEGEWEDALAKGADKIGGDEGDLLYARIVWLMHDYGVANSNLFKECKLSAVRADKGFELIQKQFPESLSVKSERALLACLARNRKTAHALFDSLDGKVDLSVWKTEQSFRRFAKWAYGL